MIASRRSLRGLDWLNFFVANVQTGFGPFVAVYLTLHSWTGLAIGGMLSLGTIVAVVSQLPAGALVDWMAGKRLAAVLGIGAIAAAALLFVLLPTEFGIGLAEILHGFASCMLNQAIAAISLALVARHVLGERLGRNARFASLGNGLSAMVMGITGFYLAGASVFVLTAMLAIPALVALSTIEPRSVAPSRPMIRNRRTLGELGRLFLDRRLIAFMVCVAFFQLADAAMLPFIGNRIAAHGGDLANLVIGGAIVWPQLVVAAVSPTVGWAAERYGRRAVLLAGFAALPVRGLLFALVDGPMALMAIQGLDGIGAATMGVMLPLIAADIAAERGHFNLTMGAIGLAASGGAAVSTTLAGGVEQLLGNRAAFGALALAGLIGTLLVWLIMPESGPGGPGAAEPAGAPAGAQPVSPSS